jgi:hypothetical protein
MEVCEGNGTGKVQDDGVDSGGIHPPGIVHMIRSQDERDEDMRGDIRDWRCIWRWE